MIETKHAPRSERCLEAFAGVARKLPEIPDGSVVLTFSYDTGERYFSVDGLFDAGGSAVRASDDGNQRVARAAV